MLRRPLAITVVLSLALVPPSLAAPLVPHSSGPPAYPAGEIVMLVRDRAPDGSAARPAADPPALTAALARFALEPAKANVERSRRGGYSVRLMRSSLAGFDALAAAAELRGTPGVLAAMPNYRLRLFDTLPNDPMRPDQWYVNNGDSADIELPGAWDIARGDTGTAIGVMDTGVDLGHPDLAAQIWTNWAEKGGAPGVDDDGNGKIDDVHGWDFGDDDADPNPEPMFEDIGLGLIMDIAFHGTFVSGIASAATGNGVGISGAAWKCRVLPLKVSNAAGEITSDAMAAAFAYATDLGVPVLNMSLGTPDGPGIPEFFQVLVDAADAAGVLCVASAGNDGTDALNYPAASDKVLAVGATDDTRARASFSNYGAWVDCAAPGAYMLSAIHRNYVVDDLSQLLYEYFFYWDGFNPYMYGDGTSFSSPLAAGVCALVRAQHPSLTPAQTRAHIVATGDPIAFDEPIGTKVNAWRAVSSVVLAADDRSPAPLALALETPRPQPMRESGTLGFTLPASGRARLEMFDPAGRRVRVLADGAFAAGRNTIGFDGRDGSGAPLASGIYFVRLESGGRTAHTRMVFLGR